MYERLGETNTTLEKLKANPVAIASFILPHIALGQAVSLEALTDGFTFTTGSSFVTTSIRTITVWRTGDLILLDAGVTDTIRVVESDIRVERNGVVATYIHVIDKVIK